MCPKGIRSRAGIFLTGLMLGLGGCAQKAAQPPAPPVPRTPPADTGTPDKPMPAPSPAGKANAAPAENTPCAYHEQRGIAQIVTLSGEKAGFLFFPGERRQALPVRPGWVPGLEFRALWLEPDAAQPHCAPHLELVEPIGP